MWVKLLYLNTVNIVLLPFIYLQNIEIFYEYMTLKYLYTIKMVPYK